MITQSGPSAGRLLAALLLVLAFGAAPAPAAQLYLEKIDLPAAGGALDLNDSGQVVGTYGGSGIGEAFFHDNGTTHFINPAGWSNSIAYRISENGNVAGFGVDGGVTKGFLRSGGVTTTVLPAGWTAAQAMGVNDGGAVVGFGTTGGTERAFGYDSGFYVFFSPPGSLSSRAFDVNNSSQIVGSAEDAAGKRAYLFEGGTYSYPSPPGWTDTEAVRINERGDVLGQGMDGTFRKCFLLRDGVYTTIFAPGSIYTICGDLNEQGDVTGLGYSIGGIRSFVWREGEYFFFDELISSLITSAAVNNERRLAGSVRIAGASTAVTAAILPVASLQVAGGDGPVAVPRAAAPPVKLSLLGWTLVGRRVDWWFFVQTPAGIFSFDVPGRRWAPGLFPSAGIPLRDIGPYRVPPAGRAAGAYTYHFGVDFIPNGVMDGRYFVYDSITVFLQ